LRYIVGVNLKQTAEMNVSGFHNYSTTSAGNEFDDEDASQTIDKVGLVIWTTALALGIPGNILSAIVWIRRVIGNNSSAVYLAALAIIDLVVLLGAGFVVLILLVEKDLDNLSPMYAIPYGLIAFIVLSAAILEPLLVISFSLERLIAILRPLQVCYTDHTYSIV